MKDTIDNLLDEVLEKFMYSFTHLDDPYDLAHAKSEIKQALLKDMLGLIGENETPPKLPPMSGMLLDPKMSGRNDLRSQLRQEITNYINGDSDE